MTISYKVLTAVLAAGLTIGATGATFAAQKGPNHSNNFSAYQTQPPKTQKKQGLPPGVNCEPGFYGLANCNVSRNGRTFGPEGYDYAIETGQHIGR